jgi:hypothetical protein
VANVLHPRRTEAYPERQVPRVCLNRGPVNSCQGHVHFQHYSTVTMLLIPSIPRSLLSLLGILLLAQDVHGIGYHGQQCVLKKHNAPPRFKSSTPTTPQQTQTPIVSMSSTPSPSPSPSIAPVGLSRTDLDNVRARLLERVFDEPVRYTLHAFLQRLANLIPCLSLVGSGALLLKLSSRWSCHYSPSSAPALSLHLFIWTKINEITSCSI